MEIIEFTWARKRHDDGFRASWIEDDGCKTFGKLTIAADAGGVLRGSRCHAQEEERGRGKGARDLTGVELGRLLDIVPRKEWAALAASRRWQVERLVRDVDALHRLAAGLDEQQAVALAAGANAYVTLCPHDRARPLFEPATPRRGFGPATGGDPERIVELEFVEARTSDRTMLGHVACCRVRTADGGRGPIELVTDIDFDGVLEVALAPGSPRRSIATAGDRFRTSDERVLVFTRLPASWWMVVAERVSARAELERVNEHLYRCLAGRFDASCRQRLCDGEPVIGVIGPPPALPQPVPVFDPRDRVLRPRTLFGRWGRPRRA